MAVYNPNGSGGVHMDASISGKKAAPAKVAPGKKVMPGKKTAPGKALPFPPKKAPAKKGK